MIISLKTGFQVVGHYKLKYLDPPLLWDEVGVTPTRVTYISVVRTHVQQNTQRNLTDSLRK